MRYIPAALQAALNTGATTLALYWRVDRQDGVTLGFTDHDLPLTIDGLTCEALSSFTASAIEDQLGLAVSNLDVLGGLSSDSISEDDIAAGRYDGAEITIGIVNWQDTTQAAVLMRGTTGQIQHGDLAFQAELRSLGQAFAQYIGSLCGPKCRVPRLGDTGSGLEGGCNFSLPAPVAGVVATVTNRKQFTVTCSGSFPDGGGGALSAGYFAYGYVTFTDGNNNGVSLEILNSSGTSSPVTISMRMPFPADIQVGDTLTLQIGCDKTLPVCKQNFDNVANFRGEPYVPGKDFVFKVNGE